MSRSRHPLPLFDLLENINDQTPPIYLKDNQKLDFLIISDFLKNYTGSRGTFNSYRREVERLFHWCWSYCEKSIKDLSKNEIRDYIKFCKKPPKSWIGIQKASRFISKEGLRIPNPLWRPFVVSVSKVARKKGIKPDRDKFELSQGALKELLAILSTFYNYLVQEELAQSNPVALIRQKGQIIRKYQEQPAIRRLTEIQWRYVLNTAKRIAVCEPSKHERTLFIMSALYSMYLRISELTASERWTPQMNHFKQDSDGNWWFLTVGKGNKQRQIAVSKAMLDSLKRWRIHLNLTPLPTPNDTTPLIPKTKGQGPITCTSHIRKIVQACFDKSIEQLYNDQLPEDAESLCAATVHWLRHTGISDDVKFRPREHVRDDAGHSSSAITDKYIDVELKERHKSAQDKPLTSSD